MINLYESRGGVMKKFSVIMPVYCGAITVRKAIESVLAQTYENFELILINDMSSDNSMQILNEFKPHPKVTVLASSTNNGIGATRNAGIQVATGDYISFLDQDDIWYHDKLDSDALTFMDSKADIICHSLFVVNEIKHTGAKRMPRKWEMWEDDMFRQLLFYRNELSISAASIKREVVDKIGNFTIDTTLAYVEDYDYWLRAAQQKLKFQYTKSLVGEYHIHKNSNSRNITKMMASEYNLLNRYFKEMKKRPSDYFLYLQKWGYIGAKMIKGMII